MDDTRDIRPPAQSGDDSGTGLGPTEEDRDAAREAERDEDLVDEMSEESFPTSDPPSTWAGRDRP